MNNYLASLRYYSASLFDYFNKILPQFYFYAGILKIIFLIISLVFFVGIIILLFKASWFRRRYLEKPKELSFYKSLAEKKTFKEWQKIIKRLESGIEPEYKLAIIEADGILDAILDKMGYSGETMGEKLRKIEAPVLPNISGISEAHKIRNNIVHDPDCMIDLAKAKEVIGVYEQALRDLEVL